MVDDETRRIAELNDSIRKTFMGGLVLLSGGVDECPYRDKILHAVKE